MTEKRDHFKESKGYIDKDLELATKHAADSMVLLQLVEGELSKHNAKIANVFFNQWPTQISIYCNKQSDIRKLISDLVKRFGKFDKRVATWAGASEKESPDAVHLVYEREDPNIVVSVANPATCKVVFKKVDVPAVEAREATTKMEAFIECAGDKDTPLGTDNVK